MSAWPIPKLFAGQSVAIIAGGPSATPTAIESVLHYPRIAVRNAYRFALDADVLLSLDADAPWFAEAGRAGASGLWLTGNPEGADEPYSHYIGLRYERFRVDANTEKEVRNSGLAAIRVAAEMGAARILLAGFDPDVAGYADGYTPGVQQAGRPYGDMAIALAAIIAELRAKGIEVERVKEPVAPEPVGVTDDHVAQEYPLPMEPASFWNRNG